MALHIRCRCRHPHRSDEQSKRCPDSHLWPCMQSNHDAGCGHGSGDGSNHDASGGSDCPAPTKVHHAIDSIAGSCEQRICPTMPRARGQKRTGVRAVRGPTYDARKARPCACDDGIPPSCRVEPSGRPSWNTNFAALLTTTFTMAPASRRQLSVNHRDGWQYACCPPKAKAHTAPFRRYNTDKATSRVQSGLVALAILRHIGCTVQCSAVLLQC